MFALFKNRFPQDRRLSAYAEKYDRMKVLKIAEVERHVEKAFKYRAAYIIKGEELDTDWVYVACLHFLKNKNDARNNALRQDPEAFFGSCRDINNIEEFLAMAEKTTTLWFYRNRKYNPTIWGCTSLCPKDTVGVAAFIKVLCDKTGIILNREKNG